MNPSIFEVLRVGGTALNSQNDVQPVLLQRSASVIAENSCCQEQPLLLQRTALEQISRPFLHNKSSRLQGKTYNIADHGQQLSCGNIHTRQECLTLIK